MKIGYVISQLQINTLDKKKKISINESFKEYEEIMELVNTYGGFKFDDDTSKINIVFDYFIDSTMLKKSLEAINKSLLDKKFFLDGKFVILGADFEFIIMLNYIDGKVYQKMKKLKLV